MSTKQLRKYLEKERLGIVEHNTKAIADLLDTVGGVSELAVMLNIGYHTVKSWKDRGRISKAGAKLVAENDRLGEYYISSDLRKDLLDK